MTKPLSFLAIGVAASICFPCAQSIAAVPSASTTTSDEAAIYEAFLNHWNGGNHSPMLIAAIAEPPEQQDVERFTKCASEAGNKGVKWQVASSRRNLKDILGNLSYINFVDPKKWHARDPGELMAKGQSVGEAVNAGFSHALTFFSTITFDKERQLAAFSYSFECGSLCGTGGEVLFTKTSKGWVQSSQRCGGWISFLHTHIAKIGRIA